MKRIRNENINTKEYWGNVHKSGQMVEGDDWLKNSVITNHTSELASENSTIFIQDMKSKTDQWALATLVRKERVVDPRPQYQRGPVWSLSQKQLLIDSVLRGIDIPKIYLRELPAQITRKRRPNYQYEVIDGQQRLRAMWDFFRDDFGLADDSDPVDGFKIAGFQYSDLPERLKDDLDIRQLSVVIISDADDIEIEEMFLRLQNGTTLKAAERRNAISGKVRDFIKAVSQHKLFKKSVIFKDTRFAFNAVAAQMLALELVGGPTDIKDRNLEQVYRNNDFNPNGRAPKHLKKVLTYLAKEFDERTPELKKQVVVSLYLMVSDLLKNYSISRTLKRGEFKDWFLEFEKYKITELAKPDEEKRDSDIETYNFHIQQGTNRKESLAARHESLMKLFLLRFPKVEYRDPQRLFSSIQRLAIFRRDGGLCRSCRKKVDWDDFAADHIKPHIKGGKTTLENGQLLCALCNSKKLDK